MVNTTTNVCDNVCVWDGNPDTWTPPSDQLMLVQATTPAKVWEWDGATETWVLGVEVGEGQIGFTWDGTYLITDQTQPTIALTQPTTVGAQTL